jgi:hypothetical protein
MVPVSENALLEPQMSTLEWWAGGDGRWYPPFDGKRYGVPQWHPPVVRPVGLPVGKTREPWVVAVLSIVTLGIYGIYWQYCSFRDLKRFTGRGIGGGVGLVLAIFVSIVNAFLLPSEVGRSYTDENKTPPVDGPTGVWVLLPIVGFVVWIILTQSALNDLWKSYEESAKV